MVVELCDMHGVCALAVCVYKPIFTRACLAWQRGPDSCLVWQVSSVTCAGLVLSLCSNAEEVQPQMLTPVGGRQLTAETRPLTSNDLNTLVQGVRAAQVRSATSGRMLSTKMVF